MNCYLTAFVSRPTLQEKIKYQEVYQDLDSATAKLDSLLSEKRNENWAVEVVPDHELAEDSGNLLVLAMGELAETLDSVVWAISTEKTPRSSDGEMYPEHEDVTGIVNARNIAEQGFLASLIATIKMYPIASAGIGFFLFWLFFL